MKVSSSLIPSSFIDLPMMMIIIILIIISPLLPTAISDGNRLRSSSCSGKQTHPGTPFYKSRTYVMELLAKYTPSVSNHGFAKASWGPGPGSTDWAYGLALCRGDISDSNKLDHCTICLIKAITNIKCTNNRAAIIYYDHCLLKFSDQKFFGQIDTHNNVHMCSGQPPDASNKYTIKTKDLLNKLVGEVVKQRDTMFASGKDDTSGVFVVYGMVQCTRDLDVNKCKGCLQNVMEDISTAAGADCLPKTSGIFFSGSCVVRYDKNPFLL